MAERRLHETAFPFDPLRTTFDPELAAYYVTVIDPPATASYRRALSAVKSYNDALYALASGADAAALAGKITRLSAIGAGAAADLAALASAGPTSGAAAGVAAAKSVNTVLAGLEPITAQLIAFQTRAQFRQDLVDSAPVIREAIEKVRETLPDVFEKLRTDVQARANLDPARFGTLTAAEQEQIRLTFRLVATWAVLLDASLAAFEVALAAIERNDGAGSFDGVLLASEQLAGAVSAARRNLAGGE